MRVGFHPSMIEGTIKCFYYLLSMLLSKWFPNVLCCCCCGCRRCCSCSCSCWWCWWWWWWWWDDHDHDVAGVAAGDGFGLVLVVLLVLGLLWCCWPQRPHTSKAQERPVGLPEADKYLRISSCYIFRVKCFFCFSSPYLFQFRHLLFLSIEIRYTHFLTNWNKICLKRKWNGNTKLKK